MAQSSPRVSIRLLGGFELSIDGRTVAGAGWPRRKPKLLIKLLALQPRYALHREQVIEALWPDADPRGGANNLNQTLHVLRQELPGDPLVSIRDAIVALAPEIWTDVGAFREAAAVALEGGGTDALAYALSLYGGDLLPEDRYEDWAERPREELSATRRSLLLTLANCHADAGDPARAERRLRELIAADPLDELAHIRLMRLLENTGAPRRALAQYRSLEVRLREELDVAPSEQASALAGSIRELVAAADRRSAPEPLDVRYARSADGTSIAHTSHGRGEGVPLVLMPVLPWGHLWIEWNIPQWRAAVTRLTRKRTVIRYDVRGGGLSQRDVDDISVERGVEDLEAVVDAAGLERFSLFVADSAGPIAIMYAARHPERVSHALFYYAWADGPRFASMFESIGARQMMLNNWETYSGAMGAAASAWDEDLAPHVQRWLAESTTREMLLRYFDTVTAVDATPLLGSVCAQSAALFRRSVKGYDATQAVELGKDLIAHIPGGRTIEIDGDAYHFIGGDFEPMAQAIDDFLDGSPAARPHD